MGKSEDAEDIQSIKNNKDSTSKKKKIAPGQLMKAIIRPGEGKEKPAEGDQIIFHFTTRTAEGVIVESTRAEHGGKGLPCKLILGKSNMIKGWEEGIPTMLKGEIAMLKVKPELHYGDGECPVVVPEDFPKNDDLMFEIELIDFFKVKVISDDLSIVKRILKEGEGWETPREPYEVKIWVVGRAKGIAFFSTKEEPLHFTFGKKEVPTGLELGIGTMTRKEKSIIYVTHPSITTASLIPNIPLDVEDVEFEVEIMQIIQVRDMLGDGRVVKRRIVDGKGEFPVDCPLHDSKLRIHYKGMLPDEGAKVFFDTRRDHKNGEPLEFRSGEGLVPEGLEMCTRLMLPGEVALVTSASEYAYDTFSRPMLVPKGATVQWEVELLDFEKEKDWTGLSFEEIIMEAEDIKATGNRLFKEAKYVLAKAKYEKVLRDFNHLNPQDEQEGKIYVQKRSQLQLNVAACYQKMEEHIKSIEFCNKVLDETPNHVKALYRRGTSYMALGEFDEARRDFKMMMVLDKSSEADAKAALLKLKQKEQDAEVKARQQFKGLFDKNPGKISEVDNQAAKDEARTTEGPQSEDQIDPRDSAKYGGDKIAGDARVSRLWNLCKKLRTSIFNRCTIL